MKRYLTVAAIITILSSFSIIFGIDEVVTAMKSGNAAVIAKYFDNTVEISMPDKSNNYSKSQAELGA